MEYNIGQEIQICSWNPDETTAGSTGFKTVAGVLTDPTAVRLEVRFPDKSWAKYVYPSDVTKDSTGRFYVSLVITQYGHHYYKWFGTGAVTAAEEGDFLVRRPQV